MSIQDQLEGKETVTETIDINDEIETSLECLRFSHGIEESSYDTRRLLDQQEGLINLDDVTGAMGNASLEELALIEIAAELVCAATDLNAEEDLVPGLESYEGSKPSLEFMGKIKDFAMAILDKIREMLDRLLSFIRSGISRNNQLRLRLQIQLKLLRRSKLDKPFRTEPIAIKDANGLAVNYTYPELKNSQAVKQYLATNLAELMAVTKVIYNDLSDKVIHGSKKMSEELRAVAGDKDPETSLAASNFAVADVLSPLKTILKSKQERSGITIPVSTHLLGNAVIGLVGRDKTATAFATRLMAGDKPSIETEEVIKEAKYLSDITVRFLSSANDDRFADAEVSKDVLFRFAPMDKADLVAVLETADSFLKLIYDFEKNKLTTLQREISRLRTDAESVNKLLEEGGNRRVTTDGSIPLSDARYARAILSHKETLYRWSSFPFTSVTRHVHKVIGTLMQLSTKNTMYLDDEQQTTTTP